MDNRERTKKENDIKLFEWKLKVTFPQSYRQFLLEREEIERKAGFRLPVFGLPRIKKEPGKEKRKGIILSFQPGDPKKVLSLLTKELESPKLKIAELKTK